MIVNVSFDIALDAMVTEYAELSLHTANPGSSGTNEVTGGGYAREEVTWSPAADAVVAIQDPVQFEVPDGTTVTHVGIWTSGGGFRAAGALSTPERFGSSGTMSVTALSITFTSN